MAKEFRQREWDRHAEDDCRQLVRLAVREDLDRSLDWTTAILVPREARGAARIVARNAGIVAGLAAVPVILDELQVDIAWQPSAADADSLVPGQCVARLAGAARDLLTSERIVLNFLNRLTGIATQTRRYVDAIEGTGVRLYDTRKTVPGWRRLEKYAVRCGGARNHRLGLFDAVLIKDNHLAFAGALSPAEAVRRTKQHLAEHGDGGIRDAMVEIEVDTLEQLRAVLPEGPDIVLLDNMTLSELKEAVAIRSELGPSVELEASGGIQLATLRAVAETGIDRISSGALTHSAVAFDFGLDWET
ncbi:MAG: carboxylating nicotinate-nucleotide diphosphorylase [Planctomycetota bacterium]